MTSTITRAAAVLATYVIVNALWLGTLSSHLV